MKLREGARRTIYNNIWYNSVVAPLLPCRNEYNHDRYIRNITVMSRDHVYSIIRAASAWSRGFQGNGSQLFSSPRSGAFTANRLKSCLRGTAGSRGAEV